jgi:hypothetical protein
MPSDRRPEPLAQNRDFRIVLSSQGVSSIGDDLVPQAAWAIPSRIGSEASSACSPQASQVNSSSSAESTNAGSAHHGHSKVTTLYDSSAHRLGSMARTLAVACDS